jgi:hypothetical protein
LNVGWTASERFYDRRQRIEPDGDRWDELMAAIKDDITQYPSPYPFVPGTDWRIFKVRPGTEGFAGLVILFTMREGNTPRCVLEDVTLSEDRSDLGLTTYVARSEEWDWVKHNGHRTA